MYRIYPNKDPYIIEIGVDNQLDGDTLGPFLTFVKVYTRIAGGHPEKIEFLYNYKIRYANYKVQFISVDLFTFYVYFDTPLVKDEVVRNVKEAIRILNRGLWQREIKERNEWTGN